MIQDTIENVLSYTKYSIQVKACTVACSDASPPVTVHTLIGTPGVVRNSKVQYVNSSQVLLTWDSPLVRGGNIDRYIISMDVKYQDDSHDAPKEFTIPGHAGEYVVIVLYSK